MCYGGCLLSWLDDFAKACGRCLAWLNLHRRLCLFDDAGLGLCSGLDRFLPCQNDSRIDNHSGRRRLNWLLLIKERGNKLSVCAHLRLVIDFFEMFCKFHLQWAEVRQWPRPP